MQPSPSLHKTAFVDGRLIEVLEVRTEDFGAGSMRQGVMTLYTQADGTLVMLTERGAGADTAFDREVEGGGF